MIKSYLNLTTSERYRVLEFYNTHCNPLETLDTLHKKFNTINTHHGEGVLFYFENNRILIMCSIILKEVTLLNTAYIHNFIVVPNSISQLKDVLEHAKQLVKKKGGKELYLGSNDLSLYRALNLAPMYRSLELTLKKDTATRALPLKIVTEENAPHYLDIYQQSFYPIPHASSLELDELLEQLKQSPKFIVYLNDEAIGFINFEITETDVFFDIGLLPEYQKKGLGLALLETAITNLRPYKLPIKLIVIEKNEAAYHLYLHHGFKKTKTISYWYNLNI